MIRGQIMAMPNPCDLVQDSLKHIGYDWAKTDCADLAEARERELLLELENERKENDLLKESVIAIKSCADAFEFDAECRKAILDKMKAERAQMIAELRGLTEPRLHNLVQLHLIENIIKKYGDTK